MTSWNLEASEGRDGSRSWPPEVGLGSWASWATRYLQCAFLTRLPVTGCEITGQTGQKAVGRGGGLGLRIHKTLEREMKYMFSLNFQKV